MRLNVKITLVILTFSLLITAAIIGGFFLLQSNWRSLNIGESMGSNVYIVESSVNEVTSNAEAIQLDVDSIVSTSFLDTIYLDSFLQFLPIIILGICITILCLTFFLWLILKKVYSNQLLAIIQDLNRLEKLSAETADNKAVSQMFSKLKERFDKNLEDYKRLGSYLTHEQKNAIAILRANLELEQSETENIQVLDRLTDSVDDILTLSNSTDELMNETVDVSMVCAEVCDMYCKSYPALTFSFDEKSSTIILAKQRWIYRAISNLVDNAIKYGNQQPVHISVEKKKESIVVKIKDLGKGIDPSVHEAIFKHKYRINGLKQDGYGIGLSVVSHVCDLCQGFVYVENNEDAGASFYLSFPSISLS